MNVAPLVTIVLPTFNGAAYLDEAIRSCIAQTFTNWELIIVDDASTDNTAEIVAWHAANDSRIRLYRHFENGRLPKALNTGFEHANGLYLTWTSDDNLYRPEAMALLVQYLDGHPDVDVVYSDYSVIDEQGDNEVEVIVREPETLVRYNCIGPCFLYRREVQSKLRRYDEDLFLAEDYDFWSRASRYFSISPLHSNLYVYRNHSGSLTASRQQAVIEATARVLMRNYVSENQVPARLQAQGWLHLVEKSISCDNMCLGRKYLFMALKRAPIWVIGTEFQRVSDLFINRPVKSLIAYLTRTVRTMLGYAI